MRSDRGILDDSGKYPELPRDLRTRFEVVQRFSLSMTRISYLLKDVATGAMYRVGPDTVASWVDLAPFPSTPISEVVVLSSDATGIVVLDLQTGKVYRDVPVPRPVRAPFVFRSRR